MPEAADSDLSETRVPARDTALWSIVASNVLTLVLALVLHWHVVDLLWPFWIQSVIIGWFARRRILLLWDFSVEGLSANDEPLTETPETQRRAANFFALHYGFFHAGYLFFLWQRSAELQLDRIDALMFSVSGIAFLLSHLQSHRANVEADLEGRPNLGTLMFMPYLRILPMHFVVGMGASQGGGFGALLLFTALKTLADVGMHRFEHRKLQRASRS